MVGVNQSHLWRVIRRANKKTVSGELAERIALALDLPPDWFPETRQARLFEYVRADIALCDRLYDEFVAPASPAKSVAAELHQAPLRLPRRQTTPRRPQVA